MKTTFLALFIALMLVNRNARCNIPVSNGGTAQTTTAQDVVSIFNSVLIYNCTWACNGQGGSVSTDASGNGAWYITTTPVSFAQGMNYISMGYWSPVFGGEMAGSANIEYWPTAAPFIITQPLSQVVPSGTNVTLITTAGGFSPLTYHWQKNGVNLANATRSSLTLTNVSIADSANYYVLVTNTAGSAASQVASLTVIGPPQISVQPQGQIADVGSSVNLTVSAIGVYLNYQWRIDGTNLAGVTSSLCAITNAQFANSGNYDVIVTNSWGSVTSQVAILTIIDPPIISAQPQSQVSGVGANASFSVRATGPSLNYNWFMGGTNISGATNSYYVVTNAQFANAGNYYVIVTNSWGSVTSQVAALTVQLFSPGSVVAWGDNSLGGQTTIPIGLTNVVEIAAGEAHSLALKSDHTVVAWGYNDWGEATVPSGLSNVVLIAAGGVNSLSLKSNSTVVAWGFDGTGATDVPSGLTNVVGISCEWASGLALKKDGTVVSWGSGSYTAPIPTGLTNVLAISSAWYHSLALKADGSVVAWGNYFNGSGYTPVIIPANLTNVVAIAAGLDHNVALKRDQTVTVWENNGSIDTNVASGLTNVVAISAGWYHTLALKSDSTVVAWGDNSYGQTNIPAGLTNVVAVAGGGYHSLALIGFRPPSIIVQPQSQVVAIGSNVSFTVTTSGSAPLCYQWLNNNTNLAGQNNSTLTLTNIQTNNIGNYQIIVTNAFGSVTSSIASLSVFSLPVIMTQPTNQTISVGGFATFLVSASGFPPPVYQWFMNSNNITGATNPTLAINGAQLTNMGYYQVTVTNTYGSVTSSIATLTVVSSPIIGIQPSNQTVVVSETATLLVSVSGAGPFTYQWQFNGTSLPSGIIATIAGNGANSFSGDRGDATNASLYYPMGSAVDGSGCVYIVDMGNRRIRKVNTNGIITTVAGNGTTSFNGDGEIATNAAILPDGVAVNAGGNLFIADFSNNRIRRVDTNGIITTVAGNGTASFSGDGGSATNAALKQPIGVAIDADGSMLIVDAGNYRIRKVDTNGIITTLAGNGTASFSGDGGAATNAALSSLGYAPAADVQGNVFIADFGNRRIRKVDTNGIITTVAGNGTNAFSGDGGAATNAELNSPSGVAVDFSGNIFIADTGNHRIRKVDTNGIITTVAGTGTASFSGDGGAATNAALFAEDVTLDVGGNLFIADTYNNRIRKVSYPFNQPALIINNVTTNNAGKYSVIITGSSGSITSNVATLIVAPSGYRQFSGQLLGDKVSLSFVGLQGTNYALDRSFSLSPANWIPQVTNPAGVGGVLLLTNSPDPTTNNFWRIRSVP